jgi:hypothetical protein
MRTFALKLRRTQDQNRQNAIHICAMADGVRRGITPSQLDALQTGVRGELLGVEDRLRTWTDREKPRRRRVQKLRAKCGGSSAIGEHGELTYLYGQALRTRRDMFRQMGDTLAWIVLGGNPRVIRPLFAPRSHHINAGIGLVGPIEIMLAAHRTERFLVLDNDLTRCLGIGDITVVPANAPWRYPLSIEVKSSGEARAGAQCELACAAVVTGDPLHRALHADFTAAVGLEERPLAPRLPTPTGQERELADRAQLLAQILSQPHDPVAAKGRSWLSIRNTIHSASVRAVSYDVPERGVAYVVVRNWPGDAPLRALAEVLPRVQSDGFPKGLPHLTIDDLFRQDELAALVPPIPLWPLPAADRAGLLAGQLFLGCIFSPMLWRDAFAAAGLRLDDSQSIWRITGGRKASLLDQLEVSKMRACVAFGGLSPREIAEALARE